MREGGAACFVANLSGVVRDGRDDEITVSGKWDAALDQGILGLYSQGLSGLSPLLGFIRTV